MVLQIGRQFGLLAGPDCRGGQEEDRLYDEIRLV